MKLLAFSDLHLSRARAADLVAASAGADLVIGAGDFCNQREGLDEGLALLDGIAAPMIAVPGNCESVDELRAAAPPTMTVLHGEATEAHGFRIFGLGYGIPVTPFGAWSCDLPEEAATEMLGRCATCDILVTHSPPKGLADQTSSGLSLGSTAIRSAIDRLQPRLAVCGHIHESWGTEGTIGATRVRNLGPTINWFEL